MFYASYGIIALAIHIIINFDIFRPEPGEERDRGRREYRRFLTALGLYYVSDVLWGTLYEFGVTALTYADTVLYFASMSLSVFMWSRFVVAYLDMKDSFARFITRGVKAVVCLFFGTLTLNFFVPIFFSFDENGTYVPLPGRFTCLALQLLLFIATFVYSLKASRTKGAESRVSYMAIGASGLALAVFVGAQALAPLLPFYSIGCLISTCITHTFVSLDEKYDRERELGMVRDQAFRDGLTGVKNRAAYMSAKEQWDRGIASGKMQPFAIAVFDVNGLKEANDTLGHEAGDRLIQMACKMICNNYKKSPVFRIGGDEFMVFLEGADFGNRQLIRGHFDRIMEVNASKGGVVVSCGMADYEADMDRNFDDVFARADAGMYRRKRQLKEMTLR